MRSRSLTRLACAAAFLTLAACGDAGPESGPGTLTAVLVSPNGDEGAAVISFTMALADTTQKPVGLVEQVAGPDDELRATVSGYEVEFRR